MKKRLALTALLVLPVGALVATPFAAQAALGAPHTTTTSAAILHAAKPAFVGRPGDKPPHPVHPPHPPTPPYYGPPIPVPPAH